jgi:hypothetical protein
MPSTHLNGSGCKKCGISKRAEKNRLTTEQFINKSKQIHGDKFDYSKVVYIHTNVKVEIRCAKNNHTFHQIPSGHLSGNGCPKCSNRVPLTVEMFIEKASLSHKSVYDYSKVNSVSSKKKVTITCCIHGDFKQKVGSHLRGQGCPNCAKGLNGFKRSDYVKKSKGRLCTFYTIKCFNEYERFYKIGITINTIKERYNGTRAMPYNYEIISEIFGEAGFIWDLELEEKRKLRDFNYHPLVEFAGSKTECFTQYNF